MVEKSLGNAGRERVSNLLLDIRLAASKLMRGREALQAGDLT
jgi:hypothetical protein